MPFTMQTQQQWNWCWAAVATSVKHFFSGGSALTQCDVATPVLRFEKAIAGSTACCLTPDLCDIPATLQDALSVSVTGNLRQIVNGPLSFDGVPSVKDELRRASNAAPVAARIEWSNGGGHFIALIGYREYDSGAQLVHVADSLYGPSWVFYDDLVSAYLGDGVWTDSFLLKA